MLVITILCYLLAFTVLGKWSVVSAPLVIAFNFLCVPYRSCDFLFTSPADWLILNWLVVYH